MNEKPTWAPGAMYIRDEGSQQEIIRRLVACKRSIGWPVQRLISDLQNAWSKPFPADSQENSELQPS